MITRRNNGQILRGTLAELTDRTEVDRIGTWYMPSDSDEVRLSDGVHAFADLMSIPAQDLQEAAKVAAFGSTTNTAAENSPTAVTITASNVTLSTSGGNTYSDASSKAAIDGAVDALKGKVITAFAAKTDCATSEANRAIIETRLDNLESKINAMLSAMTAANLMSAS